jgi:hypothetical protein
MGGTIANLSVGHLPPHPAVAGSRYLAFFDECGDHSLTKIDPDFPLFVLALVVVERRAYADEILSPFNRFKLRYFNHEGVNLHSRDIRVSSGPFLLLRNPVTREPSVNTSRRTLKSSAPCTHRWQPGRRAGSTHCQSNCQ